MTDWKEVKVMDCYLHFKCECGDDVVIILDDIFDTDNQCNCGSCGRGYRLSVTSREADND